MESADLVEADVPFPFVSGEETGGAVVAVVAGAAAGDSVVGLGLGLDLSLVFSLSLRLIDLSIVAARC